MIFDVLMRTIWRIYRSGQYPRSHSSKSGREAQTGSLLLGSCRRVLLPQGRHMLSESEISRRNVRGEGETYSGDEQCYVLGDAGSSTTFNITIELLSFLKNTTFAWFCIPIVLARFLLWLPSRFLELRPALSSPILRFIAAYAFIIPRFWRSSVPEGTDIVEQ